GHPTRTRTAASTSRCGCTSGCSTSSSRHPRPSTPCNGSSCRPASTSRSRSSRRNSGPRVVTDRPEVDPGSALAEARRLADAHAYAEAIEVLSAAVRRFDDDELAIVLVDLRVEAANAVEPGPGRSPWPPEYADPFPDLPCGRLPEIDAHELTTDVL